MTGLAGMGGVAVSSFLTCAGDRGRGVEWQVRYIRDPKSVHPDAQMPGYAHLGDAELRAPVEFVEASYC